MSWSYKIQEIDNAYHRVIYNGETKRVVAIVDILSEDFVQDIIVKHNNEVSESFKKGMHEGIDIMKETYELKSKKK
jgi:hypothetical protein